MKRTDILKKWKPLLEAQELPKFANAKQEDIVSRLLENQVEDIRNNENGVYTDSVVRETMLGAGNKLASLNEANVGGDHGYTPADIAAGVTSGNVTNVGPAVMGLVRRVIPKLIAFDVVGVQPTNSSTAQVFTLRAVYGADALDPNAREAFHPMYAPNAAHGGIGATSLVLDWPATGELEAGKFYVIEIDDEVGAGTRVVQVAETYEQQVADDTPLKQFRAAVASGKVAEVSMGMATSFAELQEGFNGGNTPDKPWNEMSFRIDKQVSEVRSYQLKASYSIELAQDLRAVHGLDADSELSGIIADELMLELNREVVLWMNASAKIGKTGYTNLAGGQAGVFDFADPNDVRGARWSGEAYKALIIQIQKEAAEIERQTGRGQGNFVICSRNVAAALGHTDMFVGPAVIGANTTMNTETTKSCFAGILAGKMKVYIDQYAVDDYVLVGYKGDSNLDAGIIYSPYTMLTPLRGSDPKNFAPVLGFKSRSALTFHPMATTESKGFSKLRSGNMTTGIFNKNGFYRRFLVKGL